MRMSTEVAGSKVIMGDKLIGVLIGSRTFFFCLQLHHYHTIKMPNVTMTSTIFC